METRLRPILGRFVNSVPTSDTRAFRQLGALCGLPAMRAAIYLADHLHAVPVHLVVAGWTRRDQPQVQAPFPAIQNILLACRAVGLGASLTRARSSAVRSLVRGAGGDDFGKGQ